MRVVGVDTCQNLPTLFDNFAILVAAVSSTVCLLHEYNRANKATSKGVGLVRSYHVHYIAHFLFS